MKQSKIIVLISLMAVGLAKPNQAAPEQQVVESSKISIVGKVKKPGVYSFFDEWRLLNAILAAGGMTVVPNSLRVSIQRDGKILLIDFKRLLDMDFSQNPLLRSGDVIILDSVDLVAEPKMPLERLAPRPIEQLAPFPKPKQKGSRDKGRFEFNGSIVRIIPLSTKGAMHKQK